jgi:hypothetical protein
MDCDYVKTVWFASPLRIAFITNDEDTCEWVAKIITHMKQEKSCNWWKQYVMRYVG